MTCFPKRDTSKSKTERRVRQDSPKLGHMTALPKTDCKSLKSHLAPIQIKLNIYISISIILMVYYAIYSSFDSLLEVPCIKELVNYLTFPLRHVSFTWYLIEISPSFPGLNDSGCTRNGYDISLTSIDFFAVQIYDNF